MAPHLQCVGHGTDFDQHTDGISFENVKTSGNYYVFYEQQGEHSLTWASGNGGYALAVSQAAAKDYPTTQDDNGWNGKCLKLVTRSTGSLGSLVGMPIAAGNLFIGQFDLTNALTAPLKATKFGIPFYSKPIRLTGYYKYKAGKHPPTFARLLII